MYHIQRCFLKFCYTYPDDKCCKQDTDSTHNHSHSFGTIKYFRLLDSNSREPKQHYRLNKWQPSNDRNNHQSSSFEQRIHSQEKEGKKHCSQSHHSDHVRIFEDSTKHFHKSLWCNKRWSTKYQENKCQDIENKRHRDIS